VKEFAQMATIHPTALVDKQAELAEGVTVGPYAVIGPQVTVGARTQIGAHCVVTGHTSIGEDNRFFSFSSIGEAPQDKKYAGEPTRLVIGHRNTIREYCTLNTGTVQDKGVTTLGDDNWIMAYVHIAHDCSLGHHTTIANCTQLGGHVEIGDWVVLGGFTGIHQFCRVGAHAMCAVGTKLVQDVPPFVMAEGSPAAPRGLNTEGMKRRGFSAGDLGSIKKAYKILYRDGLLLEQAKQQLAQLVLETDLQALKDFLSFIQTPGRGLIR
jgi:UDP-N-acetylglucosamine acyltransferase